jgi:hypothetical protein
MKKSKNQLLLSFLFEREKHTQKKCSVFFSQEEDPALPEKNERLVFRSARRNSFSSWGRT